MPAATSFSSFSSIFIIFNYVRVVCVLGVNVCIHVQVPLEARGIRSPTDLELQAVISQPRSVKGTKLKSCTRTVGTELSSFPSFSSGSHFSWELRFSYFLLSNLLRFLQSIVCGQQTQLWLFCFSNFLFLISLFPFFLGGVDAFSFYIFVMPS